MDSMSATLKWVPNLVFMGKACVTLLLKNYSLFIGHSRDLNVDSGNERLQVL